MSPSTFTAGPRGRRVLVELATIYDDALAAQVAQLAFAIEHRRGSSGGLIGWVDGEPRSGSEFERQYAAEAPVPGQIADLIDAVQVPGQGPREEDFERALRESVVDAYYWQEPSGTDVLAGMRELRPALRRLAARVAPATPDHWQAPPAPEQHAVRWHAGDLPDGGIAAWKERTLHDEQQARAERPVDVTANWSGAWWSTPDGHVSSAAHNGVPTGLVWAEDAAGFESASTAVIDASDQRILRIETASDWNTLCWDQPLEVTASRRHDWYRVSGLDTRWVIPDWAVLANKYDAVHLSVGAYLAGANQALTVDRGINTMIAGWGPGEIRWLSSPKLGARARWVLADDSLTWRRTD